MKRIVCFIVVLTVISGLFTAVADEYKVFIFCNPKTCVNIRKTPRKGSEETGRLDFGDWVITDGQKKNGYLHVYGVTEAGEGWIFAGYIIEDQPVRIKAYGTVSASGRVMTYRWIKGKKNGWVNIGDDLTVVAISEEWAVTNKGYIRTKYLDIWYE